MGLMLFIGGVDCSQVESLYGLDDDIAAEAASICGGGVVGLGGSKDGGGRGSPDTSYRVPGH